MLALAMLAAAPVMAAADEPSLRGIVVDVGTRERLPAVRVTLDSLVVRVSAPDGSFDFGAVAAGPHVLVFEHIAFLRRELRFSWPDPGIPSFVDLQPAQFIAEPIEVTGVRELPALPVSSVAFDRELATLTAGNIANDPLRTVQSHPSAASAGIDFLSTMAIRGGDTEEFRVYFDDYPLRHYAHLGGFSSLVYDDVLARTALVPGAAPIRYTGSLSGIVLLTPDVPDTSRISVRYDITSMAGGVSAPLAPSLKLQASAKSSFFNLPVYQQVGVEERTFRDVMARAEWTVRDSLTVVPMLVAAWDDERGDSLGGVSQQRETSSVLAGVEVRHQSSAWQLALRPHYGYYRSSDALTWQDVPREHRLSEGHVYGEARRRGSSLGYGLLGQVGVVRHDGYGGGMSTTPYSFAGEVHALYRETAALVIGAGGAREEWTSRLEPEGYASLRLAAGEHVSLSGAVRRSHQTPFVFSERKYFASIPIDAGDLAAGVVSGEDVRAVRMDQTSVAATLRLPLGTALEAGGFWRRYDDLPRWDWQDFPRPRDVTGGGSGHANGYEVMLVRNDVERFSFLFGYSQAGVWKTEGTLGTERLGDFDKPEAWQAGATLRLGTVRLSVRWTDVAGRPYTRYVQQTTPPPDGQVNAERLQRFQRLDLKITLDASSETFKAVAFVDIVNALNRRNIATTYALETSPGEFTTAPYGGTRFFPIGGITIWW